MKILHIVSASLLVLSLGYCINFWFTEKQVMARIIQQTGMTIIPLALFQLISGFYIIHIQDYDFKSYWVKASILSFIFLIISWFGLIFFLLENPRDKKNRLLQFCFISVTIATLLSMIFFMSNRIP